MRFTAAVRVFVTMPSMDVAMADTYPEQFLHSRPEVIIEARVYEQCRIYTWRALLGQMAHFGSSVSLRMRCPLFSELRSVVFQCRQLPQSFQAPQAGPSTIMLALVAFVEIRSLCRTKSRYIDVTDSLNRSRPLFPNLIAVGGLQPKTRACSSLSSSPNRKAPIQLWLVSETRAMTFSGLHAGIARRETLGRFNAFPTRPAPRTSRTWNSSLKM
jgi:hypothetical protein